MRKRLKTRGSSQHQSNMKTLYKHIILFSFSFTLLGNNPAFAQSLPDCSEQKEKLYGEADKGIFYFYFNSGSMIPRTEEESKMEKAFLNRFSKIKIINGGCAFAPCDSEYNKPEYIKLRNDSLNQYYGNQWREYFPEHIKGIIGVTSSSPVSSFGKKINIEDIEYIKILDHENLNYEFVTTKDYEIKITDFPLGLYNTGNISLSEYARKKGKRKSNRTFKQITKIEKKLDSEKDSTVINQLLKQIDDIEKKLRLDYEQYILKRKPKFIHEVNKNDIDTLIEIVNSPPIEFEEFWNKKYSKRRSTWEEELDSISIKMRFEMLENFSYYPTIDFQIITETDTIIYYTKSQHNPPMPWTIWINGKETTTYDDRINKVLYKILPPKPILNRERLKESIDSLFIKFEKELN